MTKKLLFFIFLIFLLKISFAQLQIPLAKANFNIENSTNLSLTILYDSLVLEVITDKESNCKYSEGQEISFDLMLPFEEEVGITHRKVFNSLRKGLYNFYVKCSYKNGSVAQGLLIYSIFVDELISAQIDIEGLPRLKAGQYEVILTTSTIPLETPSLSYTLDGVNYIQVPLVGENLRWKGYIIIPPNAGETTGSFKFSAKDLYGREGKKITKNSIFIVDTKKPSPISSISAESQEGQIKLEWFYEEEFKEFKIFRSNEPQVSYTNYYKSTDEKKFVDTNVEKGKTYYYRVAPVDLAGNIGDLSKEVYATSLFKNSNYTQGLRPELLGLLENFLSKVSFFENSLSEIKNKFDNKENKDIFILLDIFKEIDSINSELASIKKEVEIYKKQDLTRDELTKKIDSLEIKLESLKKRIPENVEVLEEKKIIRKIDENKIRELLLAYKNDLSEKDLEKIIKDSLNLIKEKNIEFSSEAYVIEIIFMDGTKKQKTLIKEKIKSELERQSNVSLVVSIPSTFAEKFSEIKLKNSKYNILKENLILGFDSDTKEVIYLIDKKVSLDNLEEQSISIIKENIESKRSIITGGIISEEENFYNFFQTDLFLIILWSIFLFILITRYVLLKKTFKKAVLEIKKRI
ncbi:MAG: hypothetical protein QW273_03680, partial [Candidatus Pacearchaeota archaeon]